VDQRPNLRSVLQSLPAFAGYLAYRQAHKRFSPFDQIKHRRERIYCIGSGPSLDEADLEAIEGSTVFLLNGAIDIRTRMAAGNLLVWMCQDTEAILSTYARVPRDMAKIISVHHYGSARSVLKALRPADSFILPAPVFREKYPTRCDPVSSRLYLRPRLAGFNGAPLVVDPFASPCIYPISVMLLAIAVALGLATREIHLIGFDMGCGPAGSASNYSAAIAGTASTAPSRFPLEPIERYLRAFRDAANMRSIQLYNHSPFAPERVLPRWKGA
jgi:hypothetical protein